MMEHPTKTSGIDEVNNLGDSPSIVMSVTEDAAGPSPPTVSAMNKDNKTIKSLRPTAIAFLPGAMQAQDPEPAQAVPGYVHIPQSILYTTQQTCPGYVYNPYNFLQPTHRAVPGMLMSHAQQRAPYVLPIGESGAGVQGRGSFGSNRNEIEEAKYLAKQNLQYFEGSRSRAEVEAPAKKQNVQHIGDSKPQAQADVPRKKPKERGEDGMKSKARNRKAVRERKRAEQARAAVGEEVVSTGEYLETSRERSSCGGISKE